MVSRKLLTLLVLSLSLIAAGCAPKKNAKQNLRGRLSRGIPSVSQTNGQRSSQSSTASWGTVSGMDPNSFQYNVALLAQVDDLGQVTPYPQQGRGVYFWGDGLPNVNSGVFNTGRLHIEIWDDMAGQTGMDGQPIPPVVIHIGADQEGFQGVSGQSFGGGQVTLTFSSFYNVITLQGYVQGQDFVGTMSFSNAAGSNIQLGQFAVPACGFFRCQ